MKKPYHIFFLTTTLLLTLNAISGCKARKVAIRAIDSIKVLKEAKQSSIKETHIDTGRIFRTKTKEKNKLSFYNDSINTKTTITPVPGTQSVIDPDGTFHGQASAIITDHRSGSNKINKIESKLQENASELKGSYANITLDSSHIKSDSTYFKSKEKTVDAKPSYGAWPWMIGIVIVLCFFAALWWFLGKPHELK